MAQSSVTYATCDGRGVLTPVSGITRCDLWFIIEDDSTWRDISTRLTDLGLSWRPVPARWFAGKSMGIELLVTTARRSTTVRVSAQPQFCCIHYFCAATLEGATQEHKHKWGGYDVVLFQDVETLIRAISSIR